MISFISVTGAGGFAFDYTDFNDWRQPTDYAEWRGWTSVLAKIRSAHPEIVIDHRQQCHNWGPWNQAAGTYSEPIAGDENPESYGAAGEGGVPSLSTDGVLANNLRRVNYVYRNGQLMPNARIPGFMSHQSERSFDDGMGPAQQNYSDVHLRDFDIRGFRFSLLSSIGTAGLNNVLAMLPARDMAEFTAFPDSEVAWINRWLNFTDKNQDLFQNLLSVATLDRGAAMNGGKPAVGFVDGTAAFDEDSGHGVVFLFNPGPRPVPTVLTLDESLGIKNSSSSNAWQVSELYPREVNGDLNTPIAVQPHSGSFSVTVSPLSALFEDNLGGCCVGPTPDRNGVEPVPHWYCCVCTTGRTGWGV
eukprot:m.111817 g.111817  ORF g.111817 m.111817 type:complete len:359 (-) comp12950_c0_seq1:2291-3367(-)